MAILPSPLKSNGYIDGEALFKLVVGALKLCSIADYEAFMEDTQPFQLGLLIEQHGEEKREHYEMVSYAFRIGYISAKKGKHIPLFDKKQDGKQKTGTITKEEKEKELAELDKIFDS